MSTARATVSESVREYERKVEQLREFIAKCSFGGQFRVDEEDFRTPDRPPYRYCQLVVEVRRSSAPRVISDLSNLTVEVGGYLTMNVYSHIDACHIIVAVSRPLEEGE